MRGRESQVPDRQPEIRGRKLIFGQEPAATTPKATRSIDAMFKQRPGGHQKQSDLRLPKRIGRLFFGVALAMFVVTFWVNLPPGERRELAAIAKYLVDQLLLLFD